MRKASDEVVAGAWAGLVGTVLGYPLDVVKSRMQTGNMGGVGGFGKAKHGKFNGRHNTVHRPTFIRTFSHLAKQQGLAGMYKGLGPPVCMMMMMNSVNFTVFNRLKDKFVGGNHPVGFGTNTSAINWRVVAAGAAVGPLCAAIGTPFELVKLQLQLDGVNATKNNGGQNNSNTKPLNAHAPCNGQNYRGALDAAKKLYKSYGPRVFYLGFGVNAAREMLFNAMFFGTYEHVQFGLRNEYEKRGVNESTAIACAGGLAGAFAWWGSLPLDCVKSGIQGQDLRNGGWDELRKTGKVGIRESYKEVLKTRGVFGFFSGAAPSVVRSFLVSGSRFVAFAGAIKVMEDGRNVA